MEKKAIKRAVVTEGELTEIFQRQYNDIFSEIIKLDQINFLTLLEKQVMVYLNIIKKQAPQILFKKIEDIYTKKYLQEKDIVCKDFQLIKSFQKEQLEYLNRFNCIIHCIKCKNALHTCGYSFVLYGDFVYCLYCMKVYNEHQVHMYCDQCEVEYYSKLREIVDYNLESFYLISLKDYHCKLEEEEKIKCPQCDMDLYVDVMNQNNINKIEEANCLYCNLVFDVSLFSYECKICGQYFKTDAKIYNCFNNKDNDLICKVHALTNKKFAAPESLLSKPCECNLNYVLKYNHFDQGILYEGVKNGEKVIVCDKCLQIFNYNQYNFTCPLCNKAFKQLNNDNNKLANSGNSGNIKESKNKSDKDLVPNIDKVRKPHSSSIRISSKVVKKIGDGGIANQPPLNNKSQRAKEQGKNIIHIKNISKTRKESENEKEKDKEKEKEKENENEKGKEKEKEKVKEKEKEKESEKPKEKVKEKQIIKEKKKINPKQKEKEIKEIKEVDNQKEKEALKINNIYNQSLKDSGQKININIQNFYNNFAPIIHIVEKNSNSTEKVQNPKYILNNNYTLIHSSPKSPKMKKMNTNFGKNSKNIKYSTYSQRNPTEEENKSNGNKAALLKRQKMMTAKEKEENINFNINNNNNIKKFSASFTAVTSDGNNYEQVINNQPVNKSPNKEIKNKSSVENKPKPSHFNRNKKKKLSTKLNVNLVKDKSNIIKELKEEDITDTTEMDDKGQKLSLKSDETNDSKNKSNNKLTKMSISSSNEKEKANKEKISQKGYDSNKASNKKVIKKTKVNISTKDSKESKDNKENKDNKDNKDKNVVKTNNENNIQTGNSNPAKVIKPTKSNNSNKKLTNPKMQIIKDFNSDDYNIIDMLGEGTFSQIFLVEDGKTKERFALKKLTATKVGYLEEKKEEFELILKLKTEEEKLNVVKVYGIQIKQLDKFNMVLYILMEAAKSDWETELKNRHYAKNYYSEEELKNILLSLVQTFSYLQKKGICHRDVKPQNILYFENGCYKITDFGEAKANKNKNAGKNCKFNFSQDTSVQTVRGTELYMSPILFDALRNSPGDDLQYNAFKSDVFSLGLCFLLAGSLSYKPLSELRGVYEMDKIKLLIERHFKNRYSKKFVDILFSMLQLEEKNRPDFIELENRIKQSLFN